MNDFHQIMSQRSDLELYRILYHEADKYQEEAIAAARAEFAKRNILQDVFEAFERQIREKSQSESILSVQQQDEIKNSAIQFFDFLKPKENDTYEKRLVLISIFL